MEKTFKLEQKELAALDQLEQDKTRALAQYGALSLDLKNAEQRISLTVERQQSFLKSALLHRGVDRYDGAQVINDSLIARVPDEEIPSTSALPQSEGKRLNGAPAVE